MHAILEEDGKKGKSWTTQAFINVHIINNWLHVEQIAQQHDKLWAQKEQRPHPAEHAKEGGYLNFGQRIYQQIHSLVELLAINNACIECA